MGDNIKVDVKHIAWEIVDWYLSQGKDQLRTPVNTVMKLMVP
jgi:hypothetical protein